MNPDQEPVPDFEDGKGSVIQTTIADYLGAIMTWVHSRLADA